VTRVAHARARGVTRATVTRVALHVDARVAAECRARRGACARPVDALRVRGATGRASAAVRGIVSDRGADSVAAVGSRRRASTGAIEAIGARTAHGGAVTAMERIAVDGKAVPTTARARRALAATSSVHALLRKGAGATACPARSGIGLEIDALRAAQRSRRQASADALVTADARPAGMTARAAVRAVVEETHARRPARCPRCSALTRSGDAALVRRTCVAARAAIRRIHSKLDAAVAAQGAIRRAAASNRALTRRARWAPCIFVDLEVAIVVEPIASLGSRRVRTDATGFDGGIDCGHAPRGRETARIGTASPRASTVGGADAAQALSPLVARSSQRAIGSSVDGRPIGGCLVAFVRCIAISSSVAVRGHACVAGDSVSCVVPSVRCDVAHLRIARGDQNAPAPGEGHQRGHDDSAREAEQKPMGCVTRIGHVGESRPGCSRAATARARIGDTLNGFRVGAARRSAVEILSWVRRATIDAARPRIARRFPARPPRPHRHPRAPHQFRPQSGWRERTIAALYSLATSSTHHT
jgi:hypothetical protein